MQRNNKSKFVFVCVTTSNLTMVGRLLFVAKIKKNIYSHSTKYICIQVYSFKEIILVQGIIFIGRKSYLLKEIIFFQENIFFQGNYIQSSSRK